MILKNRIVLVTGGARRVGKAIALSLAEKGAHVVISYRQSHDQARITVKQLKKHNVKAIAIKADLSKTADVKKLMAGIKKEFGRLDVLVNSASTFERTPINTITEKKWDYILDTNLKGPFMCALHALPLMRKRGKIINIADWAGVRPYEDYLPYCVSKSGILGLTKVLAKELAPGIQVNSIAPGPMLAPASMSSREKQRIANLTPLKRWGSPKDIANTVVFLIEGTDYMTGSTVFVDGGQLIA